MSCPKPVLDVQMSIQYQNPNATLYRAVLLIIWHCYWLSGIAGSYLASLLAIRLCFYYISYVDYLAVLPIIWQTICQ